MKRVLISKRVNYLEAAEEVLAQRLELVRPASPKEDDLVGAASDVHAIVSATGVHITERIIQNAPKLEVIAIPAVGYDGIDVEAATRAAVPVISNSGVDPESVAEFTLGLMIALSRRIVRSSRDLRETRDWRARAPYADPNLDLGVELTGCTIGIAGLGHIGKAIARMCRAAFAVKLLGFDPYFSAEQVGAHDVMKVDDLMDLASQVDFLLLHVPLTKETHHLVNREVLRAMRPTSFLINCARGPVVEESALIEALTEHWIAGAALDVFEKEPPDLTSPLWDLDNVILTPHIAGVTVQCNEQRAQQLVHRLLMALSGERPEGLANPEVWPRFLARLERPSSR